MVVLIKLYFSDANSFQDLNFNYILIIGTIIKDSSLKEIGF